MQNNYWNFILGLQYNAQRYFNDEIGYYDIVHSWCEKTCNVFLVRDFQSNQLLHDSIIHLILFLSQEGVSQCSLYPFNILFPEPPLSTHPFFEFPEGNYPVAVFKNKKYQLFALIPIENEKAALEISPIGDPREFFAPSSSQHYDNFRLFTLIQLNTHQQNDCFCFNKNLNFYHLIKNIQDQLLDHSFIEHINPEFELIDNIYFYRYSNDALALLDESKKQPQIGLSLIEMLLKIQGSVYSLKQAKNENSPIHYFNTKEHQQLDEFEKLLSDNFNNLICYSANHLTQVNPISKDENNLIRELQKNIPSRFIHYPHKIKTTKIKLSQPVNIPLTLGSHYFPSF